MPPATRDASGMTRSTVLLGALGCLACTSACTERPTLAEAGEPTTGAGDSSTSPGSTSRADSLDGESTALTDPGEGSTGPSTVCGNDVRDDAEECDGTDLAGATCESLGHVPGALACDRGCRLDVSGCAPAGMRLVPGGEFTMGADLIDNEQPIRQVHVGSFYIDQTEVTAAQYEQCVVAEACERPPYLGSASTYGFEARADHPVNGVRWLDARDYCSWVDGGSKHLPTEAQWEKAARGIDAREYPWGDEPPPSCTHAVMSEVAPGCGEDRTWAVGSKPEGASPYGVMDMAGNVAEWVSDYYGRYDPRDTQDPTGPTIGTSRILRGGAWSSNFPANLRAPLRIDSDPDAAYDTTGFRCAMPAPEP